MDGSVAQVGCSDMMTSRSEMKWCVSLSSFVNRSEILIDPAICWTEIVFVFIDSLTALSRIWMWRRPLVVIFEDQRMHALLSLWIIVGSGQNVERSWRSSKICRIFRISGIYLWLSCTPSCDSLSFGCPVKGSIEPLNVSRHGARVKEWNVVWVFFDGLVLGGGQFASTSPVRVESSMGKWTKDERVEFWCAEKEMPLSTVPLRYRRTSLQWLRWPRVGLERYLARILVTVTMSGRVEMDSH